MANVSDTQGNIWIYDNLGNLIAFQGKNTPMCDELKFQLAQN